ncbi:MAG: dihydropteroate synthase [Firmicutes bacterium]|nr:dihydropteroate synthase [Bacillota bacterium]
MSLIDLIGKVVLVCDGATGTMIHSRGLPAGQCPEAWNLERPDVVQWVHRQYVEAGAQMVETNTLGATPIRLSHYGLGEKVREVNKAAVDNARKAAGDRALVAASMGPLGVMLEPMGDFAFDRAYEEFTAQAKALRDSPPDFIIIETIGDLNEMRAAILACKDHAPGIRIIAQMTMDPSGRTFTGTDPVTAGLVLQSMGADVIGFNCSTGPELLVPAVEKMASVARVPVSVQPNAGMPQLQPDGSTKFPMGPEEFASYGPKMVAAGASIVGGCCGTTPEHIRRLCAAVAGLKPRQGAGPLGETLGLASRTQPLFIGPENRPVVFGSRIDASASGQLAGEMKAGVFSLVRKEAREQVRAGAQALFVSVGGSGAGPGPDEAAALVKAVQAVQQSCRVPVCIGSTSVAALDAGLKAFVGKALVSSFTLEKGSAEAILRVARRYGAAVGLTVADDGVPSSVEGCVEAARRLVTIAGSHGIPRWDVVIEPVLAGGAGQSAAEQIAGAIEAIHGKLGCRTCLGVAGNGRGAARNALDPELTAAAVAAGLDIVLADPLDERVMSAVKPTKTA